jgi:endonuclease III
MSLSRYFHPKELISNEQSDDSNGFSSNYNKESIVELTHSDDDTNEMKHELNVDTADPALATEVKLNSTNVKSGLAIDSDTVPTTGESFHPVNVADGEDLDAKLENTKGLHLNCPVTFNRFSKWAYHSQENDNFRTIQSTNTTMNGKTSITRQNFVANLPKRKAGQINESVRKKRQRPTPEAKMTLSIGSQCKKVFVPMRELSAMEQQSEIHKWHSITTLFTPPDIDVPYSIEDRRYHMLLATILHTRCQEPSVRVAIIQLVNFFQLHDIPITVQSIAGKSDNIKTNFSSDIVPLIKNLQYYNSKVKYIIQSSQYIWDHFNGIVPIAEKELLQLPGIGPLFADLLSTINTIPLHEQHVRATATGNSP